MKKSYLNRCLFSRVARLGEFMGGEEKTLTVLHDVRESSKHPFFDMITHAFDIAVLELATKVVYTGEYI